MAFRFTPSCNCCCTILRDTFDANIDNWSVENGTVAFDTDHMELQTAGALVVSNTTNTNAMFFEAEMQCPAESKKFRNIVDWSDANNYHCLEINFRHTGTGNTTSTLQLYKVTAGVDGAVGSAVTTDLLTVGSPFYVRVCLSNGQLVGEIDNVASADGSTTAHGGEQVGFLLVDATDLEVDFVHWQKHQDVTESCPKCSLMCGNCFGTFAVTIAGMANDTCTGCAGLNGTFVLQAASSPAAPTSCVWELELADVLTCSETPTTITLSITVTRILGTLGILLNINDDGGVWSYSAADDPEEDCEVLLSQTLTLGTPGTVCDDSAATVEIVFTSL